MAQHLISDALSYFPPEPDGIRTAVFMCSSPILNSVGARIMNTVYLTRPALLILKKFSPTWHLSQNLALKLRNIDDDFVIEVALEMNHLRAIKLYDTSCSETLVDFMLESPLKVLPALEAYGIVSHSIRIFPGSLHVRMLGHRNEQMRQDAARSIADGVKKQLVESDSDKEDEEKKKEKEEGEREEEEEENYNDMNSQETSSSESDDDTESEESDSELLEQLKDLVAADAKSQNASTEEEKKEEKERKEQEKLKKEAEKKEEKEKRKKEEKKRKKKKKLLPKLKKKPKQTFIEQVFKAGVLEKLARCFDFPVSYRDEKNLMAFQHYLFCLSSLLSRRNIEDQKVQFADVKPILRRTPLLLDSRVKLVKHQTAWLLEKVTGINDFLSQLYKDPELEEVFETILDILHEVLVADELVTLPLLRIIGNMTAADEESMEVLIHRFRILQDGNILVKFLGGYHACLGVRKYQDERLEKRKLKKEKEEKEQQGEEENEEVKVKKSLEKYQEQRESEFFEESDEDQDIFQILASVGSSSLSPSRAGFPKVNFTTASSPSQSSSSASGNNANKTERVTLQMLLSARKIQKEVGWLCSNICALYPLAAVDANFIRPLVDILTSITVEDSRYMRSFSVGSDSPLTPELEMLLQRAIESEDGKKEEKTKEQQLWKPEKQEEKKEQQNKKKKSSPEEEEQEKKKKKEDEKEDMNKRISALEEKKKRQQLYRKHILKVEEDPILNFQEKMPRYAQEECIIALLNLMHVKSIVAYTAAAGGLHNNALGASKSNNTSNDSMTTAVVSATSSTLVYELMRQGAFEAIFHFIRCSLIYLEGCELDPNDFYLRSCKTQLIINALSALLDDEGLYPFSQEERNAVAKHIRENIPDWKQLLCKSFAQCEVAPPPSSTREFKPIKTIEKKLMKMVGIIADIANKKEKEEEVVVEDDDNYSNSDDEEKDGDV